MMCFAARRARTRRCAEGTTSVTSDRRLPFDDDNGDGGPDKARPTSDWFPAAGVGRTLSGPAPILSDPSDAASRRAAVDPAQNVVLEASAGTGKTRVLVERYVNLLLAGVDPGNILAITFTRKAAAEMRQRIVERLKEAGRSSQFDANRWRDLRERLGDID